MKFYEIKQDELDNYRSFNLKEGIYLTDRGELYKTACGEINLPQTAYKYVSGDPIIDKEFFFYWELMIKRKPVEKIFLKPVKVEETRDKIILKKIKKNFFRQEKKEQRSIRYSRDNGELDNLLINERRRYKSFLK